MPLNPIASPPTGKPGRDEVFQAIRSTCAQFVFLSINLFRNNAAVIAPPVPDDPVPVSYTHLTLPTTERV